MLMWSYHWWSRYPFTSMPMWEWTYYRPQYTSKYYCSYCLGQWNTSFQGGFPPFPSPHLTMNEYPYHKKQLSNLDAHRHCWPDSHIYGAMNINDDHTCNNDGCSRKDTIIRWANTKQWLHSYCYWSYGCFHSCFDSVMTACAQTTIVCHQRSFLVPLMLVSYYWQCVSIALQHVQAIAILQWATTLGWGSSSLRRIVPSALSSLADLWQMTALSS